ncbi:hypothetical protein [Tenacibaculum sp.]|uniref:hypothetical protein n=1 Tax=Tenacibaculum sp. TaxID=1906242 RepID=UPI003AA941E8
MKKLSVLLLCLSFCFQIKAQSVSNTTFTTSDAGWFQVGKWTLGQRGSERVVISLNGGAYTPQEVVIDVFKDWSTSFLMDVKGVRNGYVEQIRITKDDTYYYLEAYFDRAISQSSSLHLHNIEGKASGFVLNSGALPVSTGSVFYETGDIQFKTMFSNTLDLRNKLFVNGDVGIGTTNPEAKLQIKDAGTSGVTTLQLNNRMKFRGDGVFTWGNTADHGLLSWEASKTIVGAQSTKDLSLFANGTEKMIIKTNGNVGVGTTTTGSHKLAVEGSIGAREIKVEGSGWSDFVFEKEYELPTLKEVESHIKEKGHLKDIPSAKEVEKNGFYLGAMDAKLLQKIEELTLYTIQQEKKINNQKNKLDNQKENLKDYKELLNQQANEIEKLKELVRKILKESKL